MKYLLILLLSVAGVTTTAQRKHLDPQSDTTFWFHFKIQDAKSIGLRDLTKATDSFHFRYWMENQAIDIWALDSATILGIFSNHTVGLADKDGTKNAGKYYSNKINLTPAEAKGVYELFTSSGIFQFPSDGKIKGWGQGEDGAEYLFEYSTRNTYSFKQYWTPSAEKGVPEAAKIDHLNHQLDALLHLEEKREVFFKTLPPGCYSWGEIMIICSPGKSDRKMSGQ